MLCPETNVPQTALDTSTVHNRYRDLYEPELAVLDAAQHGIQLVEVHLAHVHLTQELRGGSDPLQCWQGELPALEDEALLEPPPCTSLVKTFASHNQISYHT